jgi:CBS domain-containing protein
MAAGSRYRDLSMFRQLCVAPSDTIRRAAACIDRTACGIALVLDAERRLDDTVTDGDLRRAMLSGVSFDAPVSSLRARRAGSPYPVPVTANVTATAIELLELMAQTKLRQIPLVDASGLVVDVVVAEDLMPETAPVLRAVIMAGGHGTRLRPLTDDTPKPMLPVAGRPLMERIVRQLEQSGIRRVNVATHFQPEKIQAHFGDGRDFGVQLSYVNEDRPLGTAGALGLIGLSDEPLLVINGDILTDVDFRALSRFHHEHEADLTVGVYHTASSNRMVSRWRPSRRSRASRFSSTPASTCCSRACRAISSPASGSICLSSSRA